MYVKSILCRLSNMVCYYRKLLLEMIVIIIVRNFPAVYKGKGINVRGCVWVRVCVGEGVGGGMSVRSPRIPRR